MQVPPMFLGACVLASIAGAVGGATIDTRPIQKAAIGSDVLPRGDIPFDPADDGMADAAPPDQYAISTPDGRIEVGELSARGLYSQQRFGWRQAVFEPPAPPAWPEPQGEWRIEEVSGPASAEDPGVTEERSPAPAGATEVTPRIIHVAAELGTV